MYAADAALDESEAIWNELGERRHLAFTYTYQAHVAILQGNLYAARLLLDRSLATLTDIEDRGAMEHLPWSSSQLLAAEGRYEPAVRMLGFRRGPIAGQNRARPIIVSLCSAACRPRATLSAQRQSPQPGNEASQCHWPKPSHTHDWYCRMRSAKGEAVMACRAAREGLPLQKPYPQMRVVQLVRTLR
jgi:hypothetical protein